MEVSGTTMSSGLVSVYGTWQKLKYLSDEQMDGCVVGVNASPQTQMFDTITFLCIL